MKNVTAFLLICTLLATISSHAHGQQLLQLQSYFCANDHVAKANAFSESGSIYITGEYKGELILGMNSHDSGDHSAIYLCKQFQNGNMPFLSSWEGSGEVFVSGIAVRGDSVIVAGTFSDSLFFANDTLVNDGFKGGYLVLLDTLGNIDTTWHLPSYSAEIYDLTFTAAGSIVLCGEFFNSMMIDQQLYNAPLGFNAFAVKLNPINLTAEWVRISEGTATNARAIGIDGYGNVYISGSYGDGTLFSGQTLPGVSGDHNLYVVSYDESGALNWVRSVTGAVQTHGLSMHVTPSGDIFIGGEFEMSVDVPQLGTHISTGLMDALFLKIDRFGAFVWSSSAGGLDNDETVDVTSDVNGDPIFMINGGTMTLGADLLENDGFRSPVLIKLHRETGSLVWSYRVPAAPSSGIVEGYSIDWKDSLITLCGSNRTGLFYFNEVLDSPNNDDSFWGFLADTLYTTTEAGLFQYDIEGNVFIQPNPSSYACSIFTVDNTPILSIDIYDHKATLFSGTSHSNNSVVLGSELTTGIYLIRIVTEKAIYYKRLVRL